MTEANEMERTPGPWTWIDDTLVGPPDEHGHRDRIIETDSACYPPFGADRATISAVPEMLAALEAVEREITPTTMAAVRAAIAKAKDAKPTFPHVA